MGVTEVANLYTSQVVVAKTSMSSALLEVNCTVRNMTKEDAPKALDLCREAGRHVGTHSLYTWLAVDPEAFKVAVTDDGDVIGVCSACIHHDDLVFVGMYGVREKYRGLGVGIKVWNACMEHVGSRNACLNTVPDRMELYRDRANFPIQETEWTYVLNETGSSVNPDRLSDTPPKGVEIEPFQDSHLPLIYDYDQKLVGYNRKLALELILKEKGSRSFVAVKNGECVAFGTIKMTCQEAVMIGPLYADDKETAEVMMKKLMLSLPQAKSFVMATVSSNELANELVQRIGCLVVKEDQIRLYRKKKIDVDVSKVFALIDMSFSLY